MTKSSPIVIVLLVLAVAIGAITLAVRRSPAPVGEEAAQALKKAAEPAGTPAVGVHGADIEQRDKFGKLEWKVAAGGELQYDKDRQVALGKNVKFQIVQADKVPVTISAPAFEANYGARKLIFTEGVQGQLTDGSSRFSVSRLEYDFNTKKLQGHGGVRYTQGLYTATAQEIVVDPVQKKVRLRGGVKFARGG